MNRRQFIKIGSGTLALGLVGIKSVFAASDVPEDKLATMAGTVTVSPEVVQVGSTLSFTFKYVTGGFGLSAGGSIKFLTPLIWSKPQTTSPSKEGFVRLIDTKLGSITCEEGNPDCATTLTLAKPLQAGDVVELVYGDTSGGGPGVTITNFVWEDFAFNVLLDSDGSGKNSAKRKTNTVRIVAGPAEKLQVVANPSARTNRIILVKAMIADSFYNFPNPAPTGKPALEQHEGIQLLGTRTDSGFYEITTSEYTPFAITAALESIKSTSNPVNILPDSEELDLFFGDIHGHSAGSDGINSPEHYYAYGREIAGLDFCALTDHAECIYPDLKYNWEYIVKATENANKDGEFVTFPAFEWTHGQWGHRDVFYRNAEDALRIGYFNSTVKEFDSPQKLYDLVRSVKPIIIPHHTLAVYNPAQHDPELEPLIEIYSMWGSSEYDNNPLWQLHFKEGTAVETILRRGYKFGVIASGDNHQGQPAQKGLTQSKYAQLTHTNGIAGVWAESLSRESIWKALLARSCFATTGARIYLRFSANGANMGSTLNRTNEIIFNYEVRGTDELKAVEIVSNLRGTPYAIEKPTSDNCLGSYKIKLQENDLSHMYYFYLRIKQTDGEWAWSSPIWVTSS